MADPRAEEQAAETAGLENAVDDLADLEHGLEVWRKKIVDSMKDYDQHRADLVRRDAWIKPMGENIRTGSEHMPPSIVLAGQAGTFEAYQGKSAEVLAGLEPAAKAYGEVRDSVLSEYTRLQEALKDLLSRESECTDDALDALQDARMAVVDATMRMHHALDLARRLIVSMTESYRMLLDKLNLKYTVVNQMPGLHRTYAQMGRGEWKYWWPLADGRLFWCPTWRSDEEELDNE